MINYGWGLPAAASSYAREIDFGIWLIHAAMVGIFVLWAIFFTYLLIKYRARPGVAAQREDHEDTPAHVSVPDSLSKFPFAQLLYRHQSTVRSLLPDIMVMLFELALVIFYAIPVWQRIKGTVPTSPDTLEIALVSEQFGWNVQYPGKDGKLGRRRMDLVHFNNPIGLDKSDSAAADDVVVANEMRLPLDRTAVIRLTSKDVVHSFFVPEFRIKQDAVPGMEIPVWVTPTLAGHYELACAQLCGFGHALMRGDVYVEPAADFQKWLASRAAATPAAPKTLKPSEDF